MISWLLLAINFNALVFLFFQLALRHSQFQIEMPVFFHSLLFTLYQAAFSAFFCVLLGLIAAPGYARLGRSRRIFRWIFLLPNIVSPILAVLGLMLAFKLFTFTHFPFGFWGIIIGHLFLNGGLCAVWLGEKWIEIEGRWGPVNEVMGGAQALFFRRGILPLMKNQIANTFAVVFSLCLVSFAVPLVLGGGPSHSTLEVLIYERIYTDADISSALFLGLIQCFLQFAVFLAILRPTLLKTEYHRLPWIKSSLSWTIIPTVLTALFCLLPLGALARLALSQQTMSTILENGEALQTAKNSLVIAFTVAFLSFLILCWAAGWGWSKKVVNIPALSGIAVGLSGLLLFKTWTPASQAYILLALVWGHLAVICLPVFRLCTPEISQLRSKFDNALRQMGAEPLLGFKEVYFKLGFKTYVAGAVLAGCWSMGEFSVSSIISPHAATLPVYIHDLLASYRLEAAAGASLGLLILSVVSMTLFEVLAGGLG